MKLSVSIASACFMCVVSLREPERDAGRMRSTLECGGVCKSSYGKMTMKCISAAVCVT